MTEKSEHRMHKRRKKRKGKNFSCCLIKLEGKLKQSMRSVRPLISSSPLTGCKRLWIKQETVYIQTFSSVLIIPSLHNSLLIYTRETTKGRTPTLRGAEEKFRQSDGRWSTWPRRLSDRRAPGHFTGPVTHRGEDIYAPSTRGLFGRE